VGQQRLRRVVLFLAAEWAARVPFSAYACGGRLTSVPSGLTFDPAQQLLSGTPQTAGTFTLGLTIGAGITGPCALTINPAQPMVQLVGGNVTGPVLSVQNFVSVVGNVV
jgi:hypothetical protein